MPYKKIPCTRCGKLRRKQSAKHRPKGKGLCRKCYLETPVKGADLSQWSGGRTVDSRGYVYVTISTIKDKSLREMCKQSVLNRSYGKRRSGRIYEHHVVMIRKLGRPLVKGEVVHHKDGDPVNNSLDNLFLTNQRDHVLDYKSLLAKVVELEEAVKTKSELIRKYERSAEMTDPLRK